MYNGIIYEQCPMLPHTTRQPLDHPFAYPDPKTGRFPYFFENIQIQKHVVFQITA